MLIPPQSPALPAKSRRFAAFLPALIMAYAAAPAEAQVTGNISFVTDDRFRARTVSSGEPALVADVSFDHESGFYLGAGAAASVQDSNPRIIRYHGNAGFAHRLDSGNVVDLGVIQTEYTEYFSGGRAANYTELYAGFLTRDVAFYAYYSPHYFRPGLQTLYVEASGVMEIAPNWRLTGKVGALTRLTEPPGISGNRASYDWRLGVARALGPAELELAVSDGGPGYEFYEGRTHERLALTAALTLSF